MKLHDKSARWASVMFTTIILLPLMALVMMDYELRRANDITGAVVGTAPSAYAAQNMIAAVVLFGVVIAALVMFVLEKYKARRTPKIMSINEDIKMIDEKLKKGNF